MTSVVKFVPSRIELNFARTSNRLVTTVLEQSGDSWVIEAAVVSNLLTAWRER